MWPRIAFGTLAAVLFRYGGKFFARLWFVLRQLWHELIGTVFAVLAFGGASTALREWSRFGFGARFAVACGFTLMMIYFGITSFRSARKVRESGGPRELDH
jgi:hypothetical protein